MSWDAEYIAPISSDTLNFSQLFGLNNLTILDNGNYGILSDTLTIFKLVPEDFLPEIDFSWTDTLDIPEKIDLGPFGEYDIYGNPFEPGFQIPIPFPSSKNFTFEDLELKTIRLNDLKLKYSVQTNFNGAVDFKLIIPSAQNINSEDLSVEVTIPNSNGVMNIFEGELYLDEHIFDLTNNDSTYNTINSILMIGCSNENENSIILDSNSFFSVNLSLTELNINSINGYFGNLNFSDTNSIDLSFMNNLSSDNITIENPEIEFILNNGLGIDANMTINQVEFKKTQQTNLLQHDLINQSINIERATITGINHNLFSTSFLMTSQNSNIDDLIDFFPNKIALDYQLETNPQGNQSGHNDFYISPYTFNIDLGLKIPLKLNIENLKFVDTINLSIPENIIPINSTIFLEISNEFPFSVCLDLQIPNSDSINFNPSCINHSQLDNLGNLQTSNTTKIKIILDNNQTASLIKEKKILLNLLVNSPSQGINYPISSTQKIIYKVGVELNSNVSIE